LLFGGALILVLGLFFSLGWMIAVETYLFFILGVSMVVVDGWRDQYLEFSIDDPWEQVDASANFIALFFIMAIFFKVAFLGFTFSFALWVSTIVGLYLFFRYFVPLLLTERNTQYDRKFSLLV
jgi:hypothetical protein